MTVALFVVQFPLVFIVDGPWKASLKPGNL